jgi:hypothetical protein
MIEPPPLKTESNIHKLIRHPYAKWVALACGLASAFVVLLMAIYAYRYYVSSTRYYMIQTKEGEVYEIDRRTGDTWVIRGSKKTKVEDESTVPVLPDAEMEKIEGELKLNDAGSLIGKLYNGTDWKLNQVTLTVTLNSKDGKSWTRKFVHDVDGDPFATFDVFVPTGKKNIFSSLDSGTINHTWHLKEVRGFPPSGD